MKFTKKFIKEFENKMLGEIIKIYKFDENVKIEVIKPFELFKTTVQGKIFVSSNILYFDSLFKPIFNYLQSISIVDNNILFNFVTSEYDFQKED